MSTATITSKGQLTIPKEIREALNLAAGDKVEFIEMEDGNYAFMPATRSIKTMEGILRRPGSKTVTIEEMNEAIAAGAVGE